MLTNITLYVKCFQVFLSNIHILFYFSLLKIILNKILNWKFNYWSTPIIPLVRTPLCSRSHAAWGPDPPGSLTWPSGAWPESFWTPWRLLPRWWGTTFGPASSVGTERTHNHMCVREDQRWLVIALTIFYGPDTIMTIWLTTQWSVAP